MSERPTYKQLEEKLRELEKEIEAHRKAEQEQEELQKRLADALTKILSGYLPICARCKRIREDTGAWVQIEAYIQKNTEAIFSHSLCPECAKTFYPDFQIVRE